MLLLQQKPAKDTENLYEPPLFNLLYSPSVGLVLYIQNNYDYVQRANLLKTSK